MDGYIVREGSVPGSAHRRKHRNNQDAHVVHEVRIGDETYLFGAVFDGCTGEKGSRTEVGAVLLSEFFRSEIPLLLSAHTSIEDLPHVLYHRSVAYLGAIARTTTAGDLAATWNFVSKHLLCTVVGFIADSETLVVFSAGDGVILVNDQCHIIDQDDKPAYLGLNLVDRRMIPENVVLQSSFDLTAFHLYNVDRFAVCTDGLSREMRADPSFVIDGIWGYEPTSKAGLQWWLNKCLNDERRFSDDCAIVEFHRVPEAAPES